jgi:hypothetical protein
MRGLRFRFGLCAACDVGHGVRWGAWRGAGGVGLVGGPSDGLWKWKRERDSAWSAGCHGGSLVIFRSARLMFG